MTRFTQQDLAKLGLKVGDDGAYSKPQTIAAQPQRVSARGRVASGEKNSVGMNKTERTYGAYLDALKVAGKIHNWWFERITLKLAHDTRITPDFLVQQLDGSLELHDTKGSLKIYQDDAKVKMKVAASMFPFRFFVVVPRREKMGGGWDITEVKTDN